MQSRKRKVFSSSIASWWMTSLSWRQINKPKMQQIYLTEVWYEARSKDPGIYFCILSIWWKYTLVWKYDWTKGGYELTEAAWRQERRTCQDLSVQSSWPPCVTVLVSGYEARHLSLEEEEVRETDPSASEVFPVSFKYNIHCISKCCVLNYCVFRVPKLLSKKTKPWLQVWNFQPLLLVF